MPALLVYTCRTETGGQRMSKTTPRGVNASDLPLHLTVTKAGTERFRYVILRKRVDRLGTPKTPAIRFARALLWNCR